MSLTIFKDADVVNEHFNKYLYVYINVMIHIYKYTLVKIHNTEKQV
jgi:hypothetical protein